MKLNMSTRRAAAALTASLCLFATACGSDDGGNDNASGSRVEVSGAFGEKPEVKVDSDAKPADEVVVETVSEGKGKKVEKGDFIRLDFAGYTMKDGKELGGTWAAEGEKEEKGKARRQLVQAAGQPSRELPDPVLEAVLGQKAGSRITVEGTAEAVVGEGLNPEAGIDPGDGLVWVIDVVGADKVDAKAEVKGDQAKPADGMPEVKYNSQKAADITVPKGVKAPTELEEQVLVKGSGDEVVAGDGLIVQYTGVKWEDGKKFDASWDHNGATAFQIGTGSVVQGWDQGLVGKRVGDRVELVIPPKLAYGQSGGELAENTLIFVVDIVGKV
ncbi:FKBP-type peptidyl-prolyl cis-trans isomerase [Streptomyces alkaliterrae]|uniref:peptidylprolyl isomerase n=1 Tax=Streptomyces alkaliterrae TaxID=2213162 RepID=A0A5P0YSF8_9ACTN|nr:FKBP-type peptidyl-prolyl cis-trans isomerase [Streptomyces alkaliterrae]MBB1258214.1 FKBP-type peptidyl-prolyl cis-trans isomerase [Streptomyces alkaliterrae]MQS01429.1 FKBP-type peptidyl-prolyl cis-trans isomerase [Streptomyces alkaliterrae]